MDSNHPKPVQETRVIAASPRARLARLPEADRQLLLLLVALGPEAARERLALLSPERREQLAPLVAEVSLLSAGERHALFAAQPTRKRPSVAALNAHLRQERPRLASLLARELAPRRMPAVRFAQTEPVFGRTLSAIAHRWLQAG